LAILFLLLHSHEIKKETLGALCPRSRPSKIDYYIFLFYPAEWSLSLLLLLSFYFILFDFIFVQLLGLRVALMDIPVSYK
jgi:hypothetical protein